MAKSRILVADAIHDDAVEQLQKAGFNLALQTDITADQLVETIEAYDAIIVRGRTKVTRDVIEAGKSLKVIARSGVGLDNVDLAYAKEKGITVINSPEGPSVSVAELVFALALAVIRKVAFGDQGIRQGQWLKKQSKGGELRGRRMGVWGFGLIGEEVAKRALAFEMSVFGFDIMPQRIEVMKKMGVKFLSSDELASVSDVLTVHVPLTPKTRGLIGKREISAMPKGAILIHTARGGVVDEDALYQSLVDGHLGGAGIDVFSEEPPFSSELLRKLIALPNVVSTPHIGAQTNEASRANSMVIAGKLLALLK
ncbi:MAG: D-2-hydroxyacid dehydrogenase [Candidatus Hermodarchaeota archaeon]